MIGRLIMAVVGNKVAKQARGIDGTTGAVIGAIAPTILRRVSLPSMLAVAAGGYLASKFLKR